MRRTSSARGFRPFLLVLSISALPVSLTACASDAGPAQSGTVSGNLLRVGGPFPGGPEPLSGNVYLESSNGEVTTERVPASGYFKANLPEGAYKVTGSSPLINDGKFLCVASPETVIVKSGSTLSRDVDCSIGP